MTNTTDTLCNLYPNCGLIFLGDFNDFEISKLLSRHNLDQVVQVPTRGPSTLDLIITNLSNFYDTSQVLAPLGASDHNIVTWVPCPANPNFKPSSKSVKHLVRRYPRSSIDAFGRWASANDWFNELGPNANVDDLAISFSSSMVQAIDRIFPAKLVKRHHTDKPWITPTIKSLIRDRQKAFHSGNIPLWQSLRRRVHHEIEGRKNLFIKIMLSS